MSNPFPSKPYSAGGVAVISQADYDSVLRQLQDTQAKLEEMTEDRERYLGYYHEQERENDKLEEQNLAFAAALKQAREAIDELEAGMSSLISQPGLASVALALHRVKKALAAPADLGMVERIRGVLAQSYQYLHNGIGGAGLLANIKQLLTDLGGQP